MAVARNALRDLMGNPSGFTGSPGYSFALQQGQEAARRAAGARGMRGSGNVLAELTAHATGLASQDYGNEFQRRLAAAGLEQEGEIATGAQGIDRERLALEGELGRGRLGVDQGELALRGELGRGELDLGRGRLALDNTRSDRDYDIAGRGLDDAREGRWWDYNLGADRNNIARAGQENDFTLGAGRNQIDQYNAITNRGSARSTDFWRRDEAARGWAPSGPARSRFEDRRPGWARY